MDKYIISVYGAGKLDKVKTNLKNGTEESKRRFIKKYPYANLNKFEFQVDLDKDGDIDKYIVYYKIDDVSSYDITSGTFLNNKEWMKHLYWQEPWGIKGTIQPFTKNTTMNRKVNYLKIYVTPDQFFEITLPEFDISIFIYLALPTRAGSPQQHMPITVGPFFFFLPNPPCQLSLWEETGVPGGNPRLSAER